MTLLDNYTEQVRDGTRFVPGADPVRASAEILVAWATSVKATLDAFPTEEARIIPSLCVTFRMVANLASQLGLSLEQLAVADITELEKTQPETFSIAGLGVVDA